MKDKALLFLKERSPKLCVIATADVSGKPEAAVMGYAVKDTLTVILSTRTITRKCQNLKQNPYVSLVIGWGFTENNVQIDGNARIIEKGEEYDQTEKFFFEQNPGAAAFKSPDTVFIEVTPVWVRFMDRSIEPTQISEETLS